VPQLVYELSDLFYNYEPIKVIVSPQTEFQIDKIVRKRNKGGIKQYLVKSRGYDESFNSWVNASDFKRICVTLPLDSSGYFFPHNTIANFRTKLATLIELKPDKWEVGLVEISYPRSVQKACGIQYVGFRLNANQVSRKTLRKFERTNHKCTQIFRIVKKKNLSVYLVST
jgi:hypothetical protein